MLYSVFRWIVFAILVLAVAFAISWLANNGGNIAIIAQGKEFRPSLLAIAVAIVVFLAVFWLFIKFVEFGLALLSFIMGDKNAISKFFRHRRQRNGMNALTDSVNAMACGDSKMALSRAYKADKNLDAPVLTGLLIAQAASAEGKSSEVETALTNVLSEDKGRFAAIRGLMQQRLENGDKDTAMKLALKAHELKPNDSQTINTLMDLQVEAGDFEAARKTLKAKAKTEKLPTGIVTRREAVLAIAEAQTVDKSLDEERYTDRVLLAHRLAPTLVPAAVLAAKAKAKAGNLRAADTILVKAWNAQPHPDIAAAYAGLVEGETPEARLRRFKVLIKRQKNHPETRMLEAELLIAAEDFPAARRAMGELADAPDTARTFAIMAAIEHGEGADESIIRAYLARAMKASRGAQWVCNDCGHVHEKWVADCDACAHFDTLEWKVPPENTTQETGLGLLLPMLDAGAAQPLAKTSEDIEDIAPNEVTDITPGSEVADADTVSSSPKG